MFIKKFNKKKNLWLKSFNHGSILNTSTPNLNLIPKFKSNVFMPILMLYDDFNKDSFNRVLMENLQLNSTYSILIKLGYDSNTKFFMLGAQFGIKVAASHNINYYKNYYDIIIDQIIMLIERYDIDCDPETITILYKSINIPVSLAKVDIEYISKTLNKSVFNRPVIKKNYGSHYLPLTLDSNYLGYSIEGDIKLQYVIEFRKRLEANSIYVNSSELNVWFYHDLIQKSNIFINTISLNNNKKEVIILDVDLQTYISCYLLLSNEPGTTIKSNINKNCVVDNIIRTYHLNDKGRVRIVFDLNTGVCLFKAVDIELSSDLFARKINNYSLTVNNKTKEVVEISRSVKFDSIKVPKYINSYMSNPNIGVLDVETFKNSKNLGQVYCLGFATLQDYAANRINYFYLSEEYGPFLNSDMLVIFCINSMLESKYNNYYWFIHNMGKFDMVYIYKILENYNLYYKGEYYKLNTTYKEGKMLKLVIRRKTDNNKYIKITFLDSINFLPGSLDTLTRDFKVKYLKGKFPYSFVNESNLNYIGNTPDIKYYKNLSISDYNQHYFSKNWSLKTETLSYLKGDILGLLEVLDKFKRSLFLNHNIELTEGLTISRLALNKYLRGYLKNSQIPLINKSNSFDYIYYGYFGGRTEVFKPYGKNLYYYDVNSLYPYAALNNMPGLKASFIKSLTKEGLNLEDLFGMFKAKVNTNNNSYLGLLPVKSKWGLIFPNGEFEGIWTSVELKFAQKNGYNIQIQEGYVFEEKESYFKDYIKDQYELKSNSSGSERIVNKSLLNNLLGRFGLNIFKPVSKVVHKTKLDYLLSTRKVQSIQEINENTFLVNYFPSIDNQVCLEHGVDMLKVLNEEKNNLNLEKNLDLFDDVSLIVSAMVNSYARVFMLEIFLAVLKAGGNIYYTDTDSLITDFPLEKIDPNLVGTGLGQFKLECFIKEAYFISNKTYCLVLKDNSTIIRAKGVLNNSLNLEDFKSMYHTSKDVYASKTTAITNLSLGSVLIEDKKILLKHNVYTKRTKIFNKKGLWVETEALLFNNYETRIIKYNPPKTSIIKYNPTEKKKSYITYNNNVI